ncbi:MAG: protein kinase [Deltaproteobacteria bacterium]|nr:protein kinase [Deltaproteobacteria bacterium]
MPSGERSTPERLGNYQIIERIATGGMAEVYRARVTGAHGFAKEFALKRILPHLCDEEEFISMLVDEARIMVTLDHPNIVSVHEFAKAEGTYLLAMELVRGRSLFDVEKRSRAIPSSELSIPDLLFVAAQTAAALAYAHSRRDSLGNPLSIVHRDVSPQNILISGAGDVKVVDFGVAKAAGKLTATRMGVIKGKFAYMSPEQARGDGLDARSDIFALGVVLWEALARQRLFRGDSETATLRNVMGKAIPSLAQVDPRIPARVAAIVRKTLERRVEDRYQDAETLESDLVGILHRLQPGYTRRHLAERMGELFAPEIADEASRPLPVEHTIKSLDDAKPSAPSPSAEEQARKEAQARALAEVGPAPKGTPEPSDAKTKAAAEAPSDEQKTVSQRGLPPAEISGPAQAVNEGAVRELSTRGQVAVVGPAGSGAVSTSGRAAVPPAANADPGAISASGTATVAPISSSGSAVVPLRSSPLFAAALAAAVVAVAGLVTAIILTRRPPTTVYVTAPTGGVVGTGTVPMGTGVGAPPPTGARPTGPATTPAPTGAPAATGATGAKAPTGDRTPPPPRPATGSRKPPPSRAPTGVKVAPPATGPKAPSGAKAPTGTPPAPAPPKTGRLSLLSEPWGRVTIDGRAVGNTPLRGVELAAGTHTIEIKNPVTGQGKTFRLTVAPGEDVRRRVTLE